MRRALLALAGIALAAPAGAVPLEGIVRAAEDGAPLAGATVTAGAATTTSGADGRYVLDVPEGVVDVEASAASRAARTVYRVPVAGRALVDPVLAPDGALAVAGTVTSEADGAPIAGAILHVRGTDVYAATAGDGTFRLEGLTAGRHVIELDPGGACGPGHRGGREEAWLDDGAVDPARGAVPLDPVLPPADPAAFVVCGTVRTGGLPVAGATVIVGNRLAISGADGSYVARGLDEGTHDRLVARRGLEPLEDAVEVSAALAPELIVAADADLPPLVGRGDLTGFAGLSDNPPDRSGTAVFLPDAGLSAATTSRGAGYRIEGVLPGLYVAEASHDGYLGDGDGRILVTGAAGGRADFVLVRAEDFTYALAGRVVDAATGEPIFDATVRLDDREATTDEDGTFRFPALAQGTYRYTVAHVTYLVHEAEVTVEQDDAWVDVALEPDPGYVSGADQHRPGGCTCGAAGAPGLLALLAVLRGLRRR